MSKGELEVLLVDAKGLAGADVIGKIDPYVVIQYRDQERKSRIARNQGRNPIWNQTLKFPVYSSAINNPIQHKLTLRIMDYDTVTADDFIGHATIHVGEVIASGMEKGIAELPPTKYRVVLEDKRYHGAIRVGVTFRTMVSCMPNS
ncbi:elicitor-responsive protein 1-like isoform X1 [Musa acuminata AAA Group]|uniref:(wild Malaysian banana) hypothetical protein n=1 Tax=Musa acuminata subsp. malaccensis TaxID=214687 RepID=A0A8D7AB21_MUSAM|nr:unnamed protein product [Musa acuminata subsp. malaccensis]